MIHFSVFAGIATDGAEVTSSRNESGRKRSDPAKAGNVRAAQRGEGCEVDREARAGIEPANSGFADRCLTTWLPRHNFLTRQDRRRRELQRYSRGTGRLKADIPFRMFALPMEPRQIQSFAIWCFVRRHSREVNVTCP